MDALHEDANFQETGFQDVAEYDFFNSVRQSKGIGAFSLPNHFCQYVEDH
jgi:hypothetical protein